MSIQLHPTLGVNPHLTFCPRCGGKARELMLIGNRTQKLRCNACGSLIFGHRSSEPCPRCKVRGDFTHEGRIEENELLPGDLCEQCEKEVALHKSIVAEGGIYWKCKGCAQSGVIKGTSPICAAVREKMNIPPPGPCGTEFDKCEEHAVSEGEGS